MKFHGIHCNLIPLYNFKIYICRIYGNAVALLAGQQTSEFAIHISRVRVLAGHRCLVALDKLLTPVCLSSSSIIW